MRTGQKTARRMTDDPRRPQQKRTFLFFRRPSLIVLAAHREPIYLCMFIYMRGRMIYGDILQLA